MFLFMYWLGLLIYVYFEFPYFGKKYYWAGIVMAGSTFFAMLFFVIVWIKNPGNL